MTHKVSPSQISEWRLCKRKWAWRQVDKIESPPSGAAALGTRVHGVFEDYLAGKPLPDSKEANILAPGLEHLPRPGEARSEGDFEFTRRGITYRGRIDAEAHVGFSVWDLKTTSDFRWAKEEDELRSDPQALIYAWKVLSECPDAPSVRLSWVYVRTRGSPATEPTTLVLTREEVEAGMDSLHPDAASIVQAHETGRWALSLEPNWAACSAFGGCPHRERCEEKPVEAPKVLDLLIADPAVSAAYLDDKDSFTLYVDCYPLKTGMRILPLEELVRPLLDEIEEETGKPDIRLVEYGKGIAMLTAKMRAYLERNQLGGDTALVLRTRDSIGSALLTTLEARAAVVVQGF